jgi:MoxR-like ATPase
MELYHRPEAAGRMTRLFGLMPLAWAPTYWNGYLNGLTYNLTDGGQLIADLPELTSIALLLTGLAGGHHRRPAQAGVAGGLAARCAGPDNQGDSGREQGVAGFKSTDKYIATRDLEVAVNAAVALQRPLLVKGEPGTGKTVLAHEVAAALGHPLIEWHIKSTTKAQQGLYEYDAVSRLRDGQLGDPRVHDIGNYIVRGKLWDAFEASEPVVVLIDEVDKADIEFPNDLLLELDRMQFFVYETRKTVVATHRPVVIITSNNEKELPDAFLRRCFFHYIRFPDRETMERIVQAHYPDIRRDLAREALNVFFQVREVPGLKKKPATSELLDWLKLLMVEDLPVEALRSKETHLVIPPLHGALLKNEQDVHLFERLAFLARRGGH